MLVFFGDGGSDALLGVSGAVLVDVVADEGAAQDQGGAAAVGGLVSYHLSFQKLKFPKIADA